MTPACYKLLSKPMATNPIPDISPEERPLTREEGWALFERLRGCMSGWFHEEGGASEFYRKEREAWNRADEGRDRQVEAIYAESAAARAPEAPHHLTAPVYCK